MDSKITSNAKIYTDIQGLKELRYSENKSDTKKEVAQQFEALLMQMVLNSMREANKAYSSGLFASDQMGMYQDMYDKQLSLSLSKSGVGFAKVVEDYLDRLPGAQTAAPNIQESGAQALVEPRNAIKATTDAAPPIENIMLPEKATPAEQTTFATAEEFIKKLWSSAKVAANTLGASPEVLLAQAALETSWGKKIIPHGTDSSTYNLFNIKTGGNWGNNFSTVDSLEQRNGVLIKEKSNFRKYNSFMDSFMDYVGLLKQNSRYTESLSKINNPKEFFQSLQQAGYATDHNYSDKIMKILNSSTFKNLISKAKSGA